MLFDRKGDFQRLNLETPKAPVPPSSREANSAQPVPFRIPDPARLEAIRSMAKEILDAGRIPQYLFFSQVNGNFLMFNPGSAEGPVMLLFSSPHGANDYLRATCLQGTVGQFELGGLAALTRDWLSRGIQKAAFDRCPRCPHTLAVELEKVARWTKEDFAAIWAHHHATRLICGESQIRSAMDQFSARDFAAARNSLENVRDHIECGIPYLHQMIGIIAGIQEDRVAKAASTERLKEFGPPFDRPLEFSPELLSTAMAGLLMNFGIIRVPENTAR